MCTLLGTFKYTLTNSKQHRAGPLTAPRACPAVAKDPPLLGHQVILERLDQQILALRVVTHQQLRVHVAHQEVPPQERQSHALHQLTEGEGEEEKCWVRRRRATVESSVKRMWLSPRARAACARLCRASPSSARLGTPPPQTGR